MTIFKKVLPRRTLLRGLGAAVSLPLMDAMFPALSTAADTAASKPVRLGIVFAPNGMWPMERWTPKAEGTAFDFTPTLQPLAPFRDRLTVLSGLGQKEALPTPGEGSQDHERASGTFLTGIRVQAMGGGLHAGTSVDQIVAAELGKYTQLASLEVGLFASDLVGVCDPPYSCTYVNTISWRSPTTPMPMERQPRAVFERLFGDSDTTDTAERLALIRNRRSLLDWISEDVSSFVKEIGPGDRAKLSEYLETIRDIERRIQIAEKQSDRELPTVERPLGVPASFEAYGKLMIDLQVLAYQADLTRVITFMLGREGGAGSRSYPEIGISDLHHTLSHHQNDPARVEKLFQINLYHTKLFAYFLEKMRSTPDGEGSLLDHSILLYGSSLSNGNVHDHFNLPVLLVGGASGQVKGGRHIRYQDGTPMTNLYLAILEKLGHPLDKLGDSTGKLDLVSLA